MSTFPYPIDVQISVTPDMVSNGAFRHLCVDMHDIGVAGLEINYTDPSTPLFDDAIEIVTDVGLEFATFASGATAKARGIALSSADRGTRERSIDAIVDLANRLQPFSTPIVLGFAKGSAADRDNGAVSRFVESLRDVMARISPTGIPIVVEATNHYEAPVANSTKEAIEIVKQVSNESVSILPDTYHMNIEDPFLEASLIAAVPYAHKVHFSDSNRRFPGFGTIDFRSVLRVLQELRFNGRIGLEGNTNDAIRETALSVEYLKQASHLLHVACNEA